MAKDDKIPLMWSAYTPAGHLLWTPDQHAVLPKACAICAGPLTGDAIRLACPSGHRWRSILDEIEERIRRHGP
jgi:hypothetical protein